MAHASRTAGTMGRPPRFGAGVVGLTALVVLPIVIAELHNHQPPAAAHAAAPPAQPVVSVPAPAPVRLALAPPPVALIAPAPAAIAVQRVALVAPPPAAIARPPKVPVLVPPLRLEPAPPALMRASGTLVTDLHDAGFAAGLPLTVLAAMIRAFSYDVDFQREVRRGDRFEVIYERGGDIRMAALTLGGKRRALYRFPGAGEEWLDATGASVRRPLLRTPVDGARLTSGYGSRFHPLLGYTVSHRGVDFGAARGTPVQAAGDGVIEMAERNGSYGNYVRVRHDGDLSTAYGHLAGFAHGIAPGGRVRQGQVIGFVGATGMATAPHLHYEVLRDGVQVNPLAVRFAARQRLAGRELAAFEAARDALDRRAPTLRPSPIARVR